MMNSREGATARRDVEELSAIVVDCGYHLHVEIGPGLLESVYEAVLANLLVEDTLLLELKSVEKLAPVHSKQVLTYLRLLDLPLGLLLNFGAATFKEGCKRIVKNHQDFASSRLRVNQTG